MILVTGADGRVGRHLISALLKNGERVRAFVRNKSRFRKRKNLEIVEGDLLDLKSLKESMKGVKTIYHLAAVVKYDAPNKVMREVNVRGTKNLLRLAGKRKVIHMSSTAVMGKKLPKIPADEKTYCKPTNFYGQTKLEAERLSIKHKAIVIRSADIYGPGFEDGYFEIFERLKKRKLPIIGNGNNQIQYVHINDVINALILAKDKGKRGQVYIVAGKDIKTQAEFYNLICKYLKVRAPKKHISLEIAKFLARIHEIKSKVRNEKPKLTEEYVNKLAANRIFNIGKAREQLGYNPKVNYERGIAEMIEIFKRKRCRKK